MSFFFANENFLADKASFHLVLRLLVCIGVVLNAPLISPADAVSFWIGLGTVQRQSLGQGPNAGSMMWVPVVVGSSGSQTSIPQDYTVTVRLTASGPAGFTCNATRALTDKFHPSVSMPIRFQVTYPASANTSGPQLSGPTKVASVRYTVQAKITSVSPTKVHLNNSQVSQIFNFPAGGTPKCWTPPD